jgi:hypothetical protein
MDKYTEYLLDRIFEIREDYKNGDLGSKDYYGNVVAELIDSLSHYTIYVVNTGYNVDASPVVEESSIIAKKFPA